MGQNRTDTGNQRAAKQRVAEKRRCPSCNRRSALGSRVRLGGIYGVEDRGSVRTCLYCGYSIAYWRGERFEGEAAERLLADFE